MKVEILSKPSYSTLHATLNDGEELKVEPGAMVAMDGTAEIEGKMQGGLMKGLTRKFLTGESFFVSTIKAHKNDTDVYLAPKTVGDIETIKLDGTHGWIVQGGGFLASTSGIETSTKFEGMRGFFSGEGLFMIKLTGSGYCFVSSFGGIIEYDIKEGDEFIVDNSHIVAFEDTLTYNIEKAGKGLLNSVKTGEGLVCRFSGNGKLFLQSRNPESFAETLNPFLANRSNQKGNGGLLGQIFGG